MRQILINETNTNLLYVYFLIYLFDDRTPAESEEGNYPEVNINGAGWTNAYIGPLENQGYGNYRALLTSDAVSSVGTILSHYKNTHTVDSYGEQIEVVAQLSQIPIFDDTTEFNNATIVNNTYVTLPEAELYFSTVLRTEAWDSANQKDRLKALMEATRDIDNLNFRGTKLDYTQALEFPRKLNYYPRNSFEITLGANVDRVIANDPYGNISHDCTYIQNRNLIPNNIKIACCLIALNYLNGVEIEEELKNLTIDSQRFTGLHETYNRVSTIEAYRAGINSLKAWIYLKPYLEDPLRLRLTRVN